jgi:hypothetical protein
MAVKNSKIIIPKDFLSGFSTENNSYLLRYRVTSSDGGRKSAWSNNQTVPVADSPATVPEIGIYATVASDIIISQSDQTATVIWTPPESLKQNTFDVYVNWSSSGWRYVGQVSSGSYSTNINAAETTIQIAVQVPTYPKTRNLLATLFESAITNV